MNKFFKVLKQNYAFMTQTKKCCAKTFLNKKTKDIPLRETLGRFDLILKASVEESLTKIKYKGSRSGRNYLLYVWI